MLATYFSYIPSSVYGRHNDAKCTNMTNHIYNEDNSIISKMICNFQLLVTEQLCLTDLPEFNKLPSIGGSSNKVTLSEVQNSYIIGWMKIDHT